jgi:hypothetical protein
MGFFDWKKEGDGRIVSPYIWIYFVVATGLTLATFGIFQLCMAKKREDLDLDMNIVQV